MENKARLTIWIRVFLRRSMRYFLTLAYQGTSYNGWQKQPNAPSVQQRIESALSTLLAQAIEITGCGRTDTGVHASYYVAHFDCETALPEKFLIGLNSILPADIAVYSVRAVAADAHARYDAYERSYRYNIATRKEPFERETSWFFPQYAKLDLNKMQEVANLLLQYEEFFPFCKTHSGVDKYNCQLKACYWEAAPEQHRLFFHITANRFLRGMVRLIVGACIQVGMGQLNVSDIKEALDQQKPLKKSLSVPASGLFLTDVKYGEGKKGSTVLS